MWRLGERKQGHSYLEQIEEITTYFKFINYYNILRLVLVLYYLFLSALLLNVHKPCILATYVNIDTETNNNYTMYIKSFSLKYRTLLLVDFCCFTLLLRSSKKSQTFSKLFAKLLKTAMQVSF